MINFNSGDVTSAGSVTLNEDGLLLALNIACIKGHKIIVCTKFLLRNFMEKHHLQCHGVDGRIVFKLILETVL